LLLLLAVAANKLHSFMLFVQFWAADDGRRNRPKHVEQRFSNFFQVGTTFISQNVLRTTLLLTPLKENLSFF
jgi:phage antirepressor YoqD-like protein